LTRLPRISGDQAVRAFERLGFVVVRQRGSHRILRKETTTGAVGCAIPLHKQLALGTLRGILKQAGVTIEEFLGSL
jgi:predicted RNA binding protein YcfA (HicA-like mRNA interferase family)